MKKAFVLLEVVISVVIISTAILYVFQIHSRLQSHIFYVEKRFRFALENSLFLLSDLGDKDTVNGYEILKTFIPLKKDAIISQLKQTKRNIVVHTYPLSLDEEESMMLTMKKTVLKSSHFTLPYYRIRLNEAPSSF